MRLNLLKGLSHLQHDFITSCNSKEKIDEFEKKLIELHDRIRKALTTEELVAAERALSEFEKWTQLQLAA